jgi:hypothetical protein
LRFAPGLGDVSDKLIVFVGQRMEIGLDIGNGLVQQRSGRYVFAVGRGKVSCGLQSLFNALIRLREQTGGLLDQPVECFEIVILALTPCF